MSSSEQFSGIACTDLVRITGHSFCGHTFISMSYHWAPGLPSMFQGFPVSWFPSSSSCRRKRLLCGRYDTQARRRWSVGHVHTDDIWERTLWAERAASTREEFLACSRDKGSETGKNRMQRGKRKSPEKWWCGWVRASVWHGDLSIWRGCLSLLSKMKAAGAFWCLRSHLLGGSPWLLSGQEEGWDRGQEGYCPTPDEGDDGLTSYRCSEFCTPL